MKQLHNLILGLGIILSTCISNAQTYKADVGIVVQEQNQWCWCANSKCILDYYGTVKKQCEITEYARTQLPSTFGTGNCCTNGSGKCNQPNNMVGKGSMQDMMKHFGNIETKGKSTLTMAEIKAELLAQRPFVMGIRWGSGGGHVVVGCAYNGSSITFMDPWQNNGMTTQVYTGGTPMKTNSGSGNWTESLIVVTPHVNINKLNSISDAISVYPNPTQGDLTIKSDVAVKAINVFNATGQLITTYAAITEKTFALKLPVAGFYHIQVVTENGLSNKKVMVQ